MKADYGLESVIVYLDHVRDKKELNKVIWKFREDHPNIYIGVIPGSVQVAGIVSQSD